MNRLIHAALGTRKVYACFRIDLTYNSKQQMMQQVISLKRFFATVLILFGLIFGSFIATVPVLADTSCGLPDGSQGVLESDGHTCCPSGTSSSNNSCLFAKYINPLINLLSAGVGVAVVIAIIVGGIEYSSSTGDPQKAARAHERITKAIVALVAYFLLYAFLQFLIPGGLF